MARAYLEKANKRSKGTYRHILYRLGQLYLEMRDYHSAVEVLQKVVKIDGNYKDAQAMLKTAKMKAK